MVSLLLLVCGLLFPPCAGEDATNCVWDASIAGNGVGVSFVDVGGVAYTFDGMVL